MLLALVIVFELLIYVLPTVTFVDRANNTNLASVLPAVLSSLANDEREANDAPKLAVSPVLTKAAELKALDMAKKSYFAHTSPDGKTPWYWLDQVGYEYDYAGENLAINFTDSKDVTEAWMNSPKHRANIVKTSYTEVGTGIATGVFEGERTIFVAQVYANPRIKPALVIESNSTISESQQIESSTINETRGSPEGVSDGETAVVLGLEIAQTNYATEVLGAEVTQMTPQTDANNEDLSVGSLKAPLVELPAQPEFQSEISGAQKAMTAPRHATNIIFGIILLFVSAAIVLNVFIKVKVQHTDLITNGLFVVTVILAVLVINNFLGPKEIAIGQSIDYSREQAKADAI